MRSLLGLAIALASLALLSSPAMGDDGLRWRRTTPRATLERVEGVLYLSVPGGRARGVQSRPIAVETREAYRARVTLDSPDDDAAQAFLRIAFYGSADGRGRQRLLVDSAPVPAGDTAERALEFVPPTWARSVKLRVLVRRPHTESPTSPVAIRDAEFRPHRERLPMVILREVD